MTDNVLILIILSFSSLFYPLMPMSPQSLSGAFSQGGWEGRTAHKNETKQGTWVVKLPTLGFGSGHDLAVCEFEPCTMLYTECRACFDFSLSSSLSAPHALFSQNK